MTHAFLYSGLAVLLLLAVAALLRRSHGDSSTSQEEALDCAQGLWDPAGVDLAERIFDSTDYHWLRDQVKFPALAESLYRTRQRLALEWLKAVRHSFEELVRTPEPPSFAGEARRSGEGWSLLWQVLRFHLVLSHAYFIVRYFGPYHRLVPSFGWLRPLRGTSVHDASLDTARVSNRL